MIVVKKIAYWIAGLIILAVALVAVARHLLLGYLTPQNVVNQIESRWRCRAQIDSIDAHLMGHARIEIKGLALGPRDEYASRRTPLDQRPALELAELKSASVLLDVSLSDLIHRRLNISRLTITEPTIHTRVQRDGHISLERLFDPLIQEVPGGAPPPAPAAPGEVITTTATLGSPNETSDRPTSGDAEPTTGETTDKSAVDFATVASQIDLVNGSLEAVIEISGATATIDNFSASLTNIDIDTANLGAHNQAAFQFSGDLTLRAAPGEPASEGNLLAMKLSGLGQLTPMDPSSGAVDPSWSCDLTIHQGSSVNTLPLANKLQEQLSGLGTGGIDLGDLRLSGDLLADSTTRFRYARGRYDFEQPLILAFTDTEIALAQNSWFDTGKNLHQIQGQVTASQELSAKIEAKIDQWLAKQGLSSETVRKMLFDSIKKDGRISIRFVSEGDLKHPKADIVTPLGNLTDIISKGKETLNSLKDVGKKLLEGLFQKP